MRATPWVSPDGQEAEVGLGSAGPPPVAGQRHGVLGLLDRQVVRFAMVGMVNSAFGFCAFAGLQLAMGERVHYMVTLVMAHVLNVFQAYVLQRWLVFAVQGRWWRDLVRFWSVYLVALVISVVALPLLVEVAGMSVLPAYVIVVLGVALATFIAHRIFTFRHPGDDLEATYGTAVIDPSGSGNVVPVLRAVGRSGLRPRLRVRRWVGL